MPDIETLRFIWWLLLGFLLIGFAVTDGYDFGAAILLPLVTRNEKERSIVLNTIGPFWEGNQVWIILGAGAIFAAWPFVYAVSFSGFYFLILLLLLTMGISRPVSFKYRDKLPNLFWRRTWDHIVFIGGLFPAIIFGILIGNTMLGVPFYFDNTLRFFYSGSFFQIFHFFPWWCALTSVFMLVMHGGLWIALKTHNPIHNRAIYWSRVSAFLLLIFFGLGGLWAFIIPGYFIVGDVNHSAPSNPLHKQVIMQTGAWLINYVRYPWIIIAPLFGFAGAIGVLITASWRNSGFAFICSSISIAGIIATVGVSMFPFILPSSSHLSSSLLVWDASSTALTLLMMLFATIFFMPIIMLYTSWVHYVLRGKVNQEMLEKDEQIE